jgi:hypothetical protein
VDQIAAALEQWWNGVLQLIAPLLSPDWSWLVSIVPFLLVVGVIGPVLTLVVLGWLHNALVLRRGRVRYVDPGPQAPARDADGVSIVPANTPYCARDDLLFPARARICSVCREELIVRCPVDDAVRPASQPVCRACGTKYVLGAGLDPLTVRAAAGPPPGGAAVA